MEYTSVEWKANQAAQIRSESFISILFNNYEKNECGYTNFNMTNRYVPWGYITNATGYHTIYWRYLTPTTASGFSILTNEALTSSSSNNYTITFYLNNAIVLQFSHSNLNNSSYEETFDEITYNKVEISVYKSGSGDGNGTMYVFGFTPYHNAFSFTKSDLVSYKHTQEGTWICKELPNYQIDFTIQDYDRVFDIEDTTGAFYKLSKKTQVVVKYGYEINGSIEWIKGGVFYLSEWNSNRNKRTISFVAKSILDTMTDNYYGGLVNDPQNEYGLQLLYDVTKQYHILCNFQEFSYEIYNPIPKTTFAEALQITAQYHCCHLVVQRDGMLTEGMSDLFIDVASSTSVFDIDDNNLYALPEITFEKTYGIYTITTTDYIAGQEELIETVNWNSAATERKIVLDKFYDWEAQAYKVSRYVGSTFYNQGNATEATSCWVKYVLDAKPAGNPGRYVSTDNKLYGYPYTTETKILTFVKNANNPNQLNIDQPLCTSNPDVSAHRHENVDWVADYYDHNEVIECNVRIDPALDLYDVITIYGKKCLVEKIEMNYNGSFTGTIKARRAA